MEVKVARRGLIEVRASGRGPRYRWTIGYAVVIDGKEQYPWLPYRAACRLARSIREGKA